MSRVRRSGSLVELSLVALTAGLVAWAVAQRQYREDIVAFAAFGSDGHREVQPLLTQYGPDRYSENFEEWIIRDYFQDMRGGTFLDVGAHHYLTASNTYYLESSLGWSGVAIDALEEFAVDYRLHRPRTQFVAAFVSDTGGGTEQLFVPETNKLVASVSEEFTKQRGAPGTARAVPTTTLNEILEQADIERLDFVSMDIELSEPKALAGFDIGRYRPSLVCVEGHPEVRQQIVDYFARNGYTLVAKYLRADSKNLYFKPL